MKIIKHGTNPKNLLYEVICPNCLCKFAFVENEIIREYDRNELMEFVKCPENFCQKRIYVDSITPTDNDKEQKG